MATQKLINELEKELGFCHSKRQFRVLGKRCRTHRKRMRIQMRELNEKMNDIENVINAADNGERRAIK